MVRGCVAVWVLGLTLWSGLAAPRAAPGSAFPGHEPRGEQDAGRRSQPDRITYTEHIAAILDARCVVCHREGGIGPFSLTDYEDAAARASEIAEATRRRRMPPWKPAATPALLGERRLDDAAIDLIGRWVADGAPEGDPRRRPTPPRWPDGWQTGPPDLVVTMTEPFPLAARGDDVYRSFVLPVPLDRRHFVIGVELEAGTTRGIHHARILIDRTGSARRLDEADPIPGYDDARPDQAQFPEGHFLGWAPGTSATRVPPALAWTLEPGSDLVLKAHLVPDGRDTAVQVSIGLFFSDEPPAAAPVVVQLGSQTIDVPPGAARHLVEDRYEVPVDLDVLGIYPHAHFLARQVEAVAHLPDGETRPLITIEDWDFNWQDEYRYVEAIRLPRGTTVHARFLFDNSAANPDNPNRPPRRVTFGPRSTDEMAELTLQTLPVDPADRPALARDAARKVAEIILAGAEKVWRDAPDVPAHHERLAVSLVAVDRVADAVRHLEEAIRLDPGRATAHYGLGTALFQLDRRDDAIRQLERAVALDPEFVEAHNNLGGLLQLAGRPAEAAIHYREALRLEPSHPSAHFNLGQLLLADRRYEDAERAFRDVLSLRPDFGEAHAALGRALSGQGRLMAARAAFARARRLGVEP